MDIQLPEGFKQGKKGPITIFMNDLGIGMESFRIESAEDTKGRRVATTLQDGTRTGKDLERQL